MVVQIVSMLPDVDSEDGAFAFHDGGILIRGAADAEAAAVGGEPCPAASEASCAGVFDLGFQGVEVAEGLIDGLAQFAAGFGSAAWRENSPE